ncbi:MAG: TonB-dependent receptor [Bacteroidetes bacterium]|nr:TonB-dependent receptor [Bacteroidota bacterium]
MKKKWLYPVWRFFSFRSGKTFRIMKISVFLFLTGIISIYAGNSYSQTTRLSLDLRETTVGEVLTNIENQSEFYFLYSNKLVDVNRKVSLRAKNKPVSNILDHLFADTDIRYVVFDRQIILSPEEMLKKTIEQQNAPPQEIVVTGKVTGEDGNSLPGVNIVIKGTITGTITDVDGNYSIEVEGPDATLVFSFIGYRSQEVEISGRALINITLAGEAFGLEEVIAVGYGFKKKVNLTGSVTAVNSDVLEKIPPFGSTTNALAGRLPGLISKQTSGSPGRDAASLTIRGFGNALIIVDGVESNFNNINSNEIESISVLKDASAAIYGARAGNGVILVTTKRGTEGKPVITLNSSYSLQNITNFPKPMSAGQYAEYDRESKIHRGLSESQMQFTQEEMELFYAGTDPNYPNTDWYDVLVRSSAPMEQHNLSIRGGSDRLKYFGLFGFMNQETFWKNNGGDFQRYNIRANVDAKITDNLSMQLNVSNINEYRKFPASAGGDDYNFFRGFWQTWPIHPSSLPDPTKIPYTGDFNSLISTNREISGFSDDDFQNIKIGASINYDFPFLKGLSAKLFINYDQDYQNVKTMGTPVDTYSYDHDSGIYTLMGQKTKGSLSHRDSRSRMITNQFSFNYDREFAEKHTVSFMALYESIDYNNEYITASRINFLTNSIPYLFAGSVDNQSANGSASEMGRKSYIGRLNYSFKNKYLFEATMRADASAKFPSEKRWGYFPSLSAGWRISEESFMKDNIVWLSNLKLRGGVSNTGYDNVGNFAYLSGYQLGGKYIIGTDILDGLVSTGLANPNLTWEKVSIFNLGFDFSLFKSKLYGEFDVFYRKLTGIPATRLLSLPSTFGASLPPENLNSSNDRGFEALIGTRGSKGDFSWDISGNVSWSRAKWDHYEEVDYSDDSEMARVYQISGQWTDRVMGYKTDGLYTSQEEIDGMTFDQDQLGNTTIKPGDIKYIDVNKDGVLDWKDKVNIGNGSLPHWMVGLSTNLNYKNFDLFLLFQGSGGNYVSVILPWCEQLFIERWTEENNNPNALFPRSGSLAQGGGGSDFYLKKEDYIRLKTLNFGYNLPKNLLKFAKINSLRIFFAGTNLFTLDRLKKYGLDPEAPSTAGKYYANNAFFYPQQRTFTFGLTLTL